MRGFTNPLSCRIHHVGAPLCRIAAATRAVSSPRCPACKHPYYPEDKTTYRVCSACAATPCTICAAREMWKCPVCKSPYATLKEPA